MTINELIQLASTLAWPLVALVAIFTLRPVLTELLGGAKIKLSIFGQAIETNLPELKRIFEELATEPLTEKHINYLKALGAQGTKGLFER